jgi:hypothetical protein
MNEHEEKLIASFIVKSKKSRYRFLLESNDPKRRIEFVNKLNHCRDFDEMYVKWLSKNPRDLDRSERIIAWLRKNGSPNEVYYCGAADDDGKLMPLVKAMHVLDYSFGASIISCIPGQLAYYHDEEGKRRAILKRKI